MICLVTLWRVDCRPACSPGSHQFVMTTPGFNWSQSHIETPGEGPQSHSSLYHYHGAIPHGQGVSLTKFDDCGCCYESIILYYKKYFELLFHLASMTRCGLRYLPNLVVVKYFDIGYICIQLCAHDDIAGNSETPCRVCPNLLPFLQWRRQVCDALQSGSIYTLTSLERESTTLNEALGEPGTVLVTKGTVNKVGLSSKQTDY